MNINSVLVHAPLCGDAEYGPEPSLVELIMFYYESHGIGKTKSQQYTQEYIQSIIKYAEEN